MGIRAMAALLVAAMLTVAVSSAEARPRNRGACDGVHRCKCGTTQANHFNLPWTYKGFNLKRAIEWTRAFPKTEPRAGVVGYQRGGGPSGHVFRVVSYSGNCIATVADETGQYERNICGRGARFMDVSGRGTIEASASSARGKRGRTRTAHAETVVPDRLTPQ